MLNHSTLIYFFSLVINDLFFSYLSLDLRKDGFYFYKHKEIIHQFSSEKIDRDRQSLSSQYSSVFGVEKFTLEQTFMCDGGYFEYYQNEWGATPSGND